MSSTRVRVCLGIIAGLALTIRIGAILYLGDFRPPWALDWEIIAQTLVEKGYFGLDPISLYGPNPRGVTSFIPPFYPGFLALMTIIFGPWAWLATRIVQAVVATLAVVLVYSLGRVVFRRDDIALLGALLAAVFPPLIGGVAEVNAVSFEVFFLELFVLFTLDAMHRSSWWRWGIAGVVLGIAALTRPTILALLPLLPICLWVNKRQSFRTDVIRPMLVVVISAIAVISPWTLRNYRVHGEFIAISSNGGINFWIGNNERATGEFIYPTSIDPDLMKVSEHLSEGTRDKFFYRQGFSFIKNNPQRFVNLLGIKLVYFLWRRPSIGESYKNQETVGLGRLAYTVGNGVLLPLWMLGVVLTIREWRRLSVFYAAILSVLVVNVLYFVGTRYRTPAAPYQILFASCSLIITARYTYQWYKGLSRNAVARYDPR